MGKNLCAEDILKLGLTKPINQGLFFMHLEIWELIYYLFSPKVKGIHKES